MTLAQAFMPSLQISFYIGAAISLVAAVLSLMRGSKYVYEIDKSRSRAPPETPGLEEGAHPDTPE